MVIKIIVYSVLGYFVIILCVLALRYCYLNCLQSVTRATQNKRRHHQNVARDARRNFPSQPSHHYRSRDGVLSIVINEGGINNTPRVPHNLPQPPNRNWETPYRHGPSGEFTYPPQSTDPSDSPPAEVLEHAAPSAPEEYPTTPPPNFSSTPPPYSPPASPPPYASVIAGDSFAGGDNLAGCGGDTGVQAV